MNGGFSLVQTVGFREFKSSRHEAPSLSVAHSQGYLQRVGPLQRGADTLYKQGHSETQYTQQSQENDVNTSLPSSPQPIQVPLLVQTTSLTAEGSVSWLLVWIPIVENDSF